MRSAARRMAEHARFLASFLRDPVATGSIAPSSRWLARRMLEGAGLAAARTVVEVGPGTGVFTAGILAASRPGALVLAVELNRAFARKLRKRFPGLRVVVGSVERLPAILKRAGRPQADTVICSLPWASFPPGLQRRLLAAIARALRPGGRFRTYAYVPAAPLPSARRFRRLLAASFRVVRRSAVEWRNLPPAFVYRCVK